MAETLDHDVIEAVRRFVDRDVIPVASELEHADEYPHKLVATMRELGLFGATIPVEHGGLGLSFVSYARLMAEFSRGWMSLAGVINSHLIMGYIITHHGTDEQRNASCPRWRRGEKRGGLALTEPHAGSDVQSIRTTAVRQGDNYVLKGSKMFITNARHGTMLAVAAKTNPKADPAYAGISMFAVEKNDHGPTVSRNLDKLGYKGIDTCEVLFEDLEVPAGKSNRRHEGTGLQAGDERARGRTHQRRRARGRSRAGRLRDRNPLLSTAHRFWQTDLPASGGPTAARRHGDARRSGAPDGRERGPKKDAGERCDVEAGMAKLFASEACAKMTLDAMRVLGGYGFMAEFPVERFYRDAPLMIIGEGTSEIQALVIARGLLNRNKI